MTTSRINSPRVLYHMVRADFLERVRRYSFLLTLAFAVYLGYESFAGGIILRLDEYRGIYNSAWVGALIGMVASLFLSLVGFYIVKNSIQRDQQTRVGRVLATTPMSKSFYTFAKTISNFAVLASMVAVMTVAALLMQLLRGEDPHVHLWMLLSPLVFFTLPAVAFAAALAVLFETLPVLRSGAGNVIFFFFWTILLAGGGIATMEQGHARNPLVNFADFSGIASQMADMQSTLRKVAPEYKGGSALNIGSDVPTKRFLWDGQRWTPLLFESRLFWLVLSAAIAWLASLFFHRFDPARDWTLRRNAKPPTASVAAESEAANQAAKEDYHATALSALGRTSAKNPFARLVVAELRLMLKGKRWWWYAIAAGLSIACLVSPMEVSRGGVLVAAWIWPILIWSPMGSREAHFATSSLIFSSPRLLTRQLPAAWVAGVLVSVFTGGGVGLRLILSGDAHGLAAWLAGAMFIPSLALALGVWSGSSKAFEAIYTAWWYVGPAHHTPGIDFMGTSAASGSPLIYAVAAISLLAVSYWGRRVRLGYA